MMERPPFDDPFDWFGAWFDEARQTGMVDPNAVSLATVDPNGLPSLRIVLLKEWDRDGFVIYTNLTSRKGREALGAGRAAMTLFWRDMGRQIRVEGTIAQVSDARADAYFATRPRDSQLGAWASHQSQPIESRQELLDEVEAIRARFADKPVTRPPHWSGLCLTPLRMELWQAGDARLHDRFVFTRPDADSDWKCQRLSP